MADGRSAKALRVPGGWVAECRACGWRSKVTETRTEAHSIFRLDHDTCPDRRSDQGT